MPYSPQTDRSVRAMSGYEVVEAGQETTRHPFTVGVAIRGSANSSTVLKLALKMFSTEENVEFKLIHVRSKVRNIPTPMGNFVPVSQVREDVAAAYRKELEWQTTEMLSLYKKMCAVRNVPVDTIVVESDNVASAIADVLGRYAIDRLVIGAAANCKLARKLKKSVCSKIAASAPGSYMLYAVSEGKLVAVHPSKKKKNGRVKDESINGSSSSVSSSQAEFDVAASLSLVPSAATQQMQAPSEKQELQVTLRDTTAATMRRSTHLSNEAFFQSSSHNNKAAKSFFSSPLTYNQPTSVAATTAPITSCFPLEHKLPPSLSSSSSHQHFHPNPATPCFNASSRYTHGLHKLRCGCEFKVSSAEAERELSYNFPFHIQKGKLMGLQKREDLEREVAMLQQMLRQEETLHDILEHIHNSNTGPNMTIPNFLPQKAKELLAELAMVEDEIARLEGQIGQLQNGVRIERNITKDVKYRQGDLRPPSPVNRGAQQRMEPESNTVDLDAVGKGFNETVGFDTRALHYISRAITGDYSFNQFSLSKTIQSRKFADEKENCAHDDYKSQGKAIRKSGMLKPPSAIPEQRHTSPKPKGDSAVPNSDLLPKSISNPIQLDEYHNIPPNKLSESIMQCLIFIYMRLLRTSSAMEVEMSGPVSKFLSSLNSRSFRADTGIHSNHLQQDPYGIFDVEGSVPRDIGPYKNLVIVTSSSMDPQCISFITTISSVRKLRFLMSYLQKVDLRPLNHQQKIAFWINMGQTISLSGFSMAASLMYLLTRAAHTNHSNGYLRYGVPPSPDKLNKLMNKARLNIGGDTITARDIEKFILRKPEDDKMEEVPLRSERDDKETTVRKLYGLEHVDPNVTFALSCGTRSSPAVRIYTAEELVAELERAKIEYLQASVVICNNKKIGIPELLVRNMRDFAVDTDSLVGWICQQLPPSCALKKSIVDCIRNHHNSKISNNVRKIPYDYDFQYLLAMRNTNGIIKLAF